MSPPASGRSSSRAVAGVLAEPLPVPVPVVGLASQTAVFSTCQLDGKRPFANKLNGLYHYYPEKPPVLPVKYQLSPTFSRKISVFKDPNGVRITLAFLALGWISTTLTLLLRCSQVIRLP